MVSQGLVQNVCVKQSQLPNLDCFVSRGTLDLLQEQAFRST